MQRIKAFLLSLKNSLQKYPEIAVIWSIFSVLSAVLFIFDLPELGMVLLAIENYLIFEFYYAYVQGKNAYEFLDKDASLGIDMLGISFIAAYLAHYCSLVALWLLIMQLYFVAAARSMKLEGPRDAFQELKTVWSNSHKDLEDSLMLVILISLTLVSPAVGSLFDPLIVLYFLTA
jgi:hypothetical protein